jgi:hypothetical protein
MAKSGGNVGANSPPFATADGKTRAPSSSASGAFDPLRNEATSGDKSTGGKDVTKENRPQQASKTLVGLPNSESIPSGDGGRILQIDPTGAASKSASGQAGGYTGAGVKPGHTPFKSLK